MTLNISLPASIALAQAVEPPELTRLAVGFELQPPLLMSLPSALYIVSLQIVPQGPFRTEGVAGAPVLLQGALLTLQRPLPRLDPTQLPLRVAEIAARILYNLAQPWLARLRFSMQKRRRKQQHTT